MATIHLLKPRKLARVRSDRARELERLGQLNLFSGQPARVFRLSETLSAFTRASLLHERGDPGARLAYQTAIRDGDRVDDAYVNLGVLEYEAGRTEEAFRCFRECLKLSPGHFEGQLNLGHFYAGEGALRPAELHYEIAASVRPGEPDVLYALGMLYAETGRAHEARQALQLYRSLVPDDEQEADGLLGQLLGSIRP